MKPKESLDNSGDYRTIVGFTICGLGLVNLCACISRPYAPESLGIGVISIATIPYGLFLLGKGITDSNSLMSEKDELFDIFSGTELYQSAGMGDGNDNSGKIIQYDYDLF